MIHTVKYSHDEASAFALEDVDSKFCRFVGDLNEVWKHGQEVHHIESRIRTERLDRTEYINDEWQPTQKIIIKPTGEFWYVCLEDAPEEERLCLACGGSYPCSCVDYDDMSRSKYDL